MPLYRRKPLQVEAAQFWPDVVPWPNGVYRVQSPNMPTEFFLNAAQGKTRIAAGDWVIVGMTGQRWVCERTAFDMLYEEANRPSSNYFETDEPRDDPHRGETW